jgi:hypothetical protein
MLEIADALRRPVISADQMSAPEDARSRESIAGRPHPFRPMADAGAAFTPARPAIPLLSLLVPFYNEQDMIARFFSRVIPALERIPNICFEILCVNDGSRDRTLDGLVAVAQIDARVRVVDLTRNFGKEAALTAAIFEARGDLVVPFDADLQDPPDVIGRLVDKWREGYEVVLARRASRASDSLLKKWTARVFYRVQNDLADVPIPENVGDFRLFTRSVADALKALPESCRFMKGLFAARLDLPRPVGRLLRPGARGLAGAAHVDLRRRRARLRLAGDRDPAARRDPADRHRRARRVHRPHLPRNEGPPALPGAAPLRKDGAACLIPR